MRLRGGVQAHSFTAQKKVAIPPLRCGHREIAECENSASLLVKIVMVMVSFMRYP
jgi:hypothetical protein